MKIFVLCNIKALCCLQQRANLNRGTTFFRCMRILIHPLTGMSRVHLLCFSKPVQKLPSVSPYPGSLSACEVPSLAAVDDVLLFLTTFSFRNTYHKRNNKVLSRDLPQNLCLISASEKGFYSPDTIKNSVHPFLTKNSLLKKLHAYVFFYKLEDVYSGRRSCRGSIIIFVAEEKR